VGINYFDDVQISAVGGTISQTSSDSTGTYNTIVQQPDGTITSTSSAAPPPPPAEALQFHRRWVIEKDTPISGVRRVTVFVQLLNPPVTKAITFQISTVRP
jgi:hypothetical protein